MPVIPLRRLAWSVVLSIGVTAACSKVKHERHTFIPASVEAGESVGITLSAFGSWSRQTRTDTVIEVSGSPYILELRVHGLGQSVSGVDLIVHDSLSQRADTFVTWDVKAWDPADSTMVFAIRKGVTLAPRTHYFSGRVRVTGGDDSENRSFAGTLRDSLLVEQRNRLTERLRGL